MTTAFDVLHLLDKAGVQSLREGTKEISGKCPMHRQRLGREDRHASWSMNKTTFVHHCFSCGYSGTLTGLLIDLQGYAPENIEQEIAKESFLRTLTKIEKKETSAPPPTEWELSNLLTDVSDSLLRLRNLKRHAVEKFQIRWDKKLQSWVIPVRSPDGLLLGVQYRQKGSVINAPLGLKKSSTLFGIYEMKSEDCITLVESPLDAVRLYGAGIPAVSSFGAWVSEEQVTLLARNFKTVVLALDNDSTGRTASVDVAKSLRKKGSAVVPFLYDGLYTTDGSLAKDIGDVPLDEDIRSAWRNTMTKVARV